MVGTDENRVDRTTDGRFPAEGQVAQAGLPDSHAAGGHDDEAKRAIPHFDHVDALRQPGPQRSFGNAIALGRAAYLFGPQGDVIDINILVLVNKRPSLGWHHGGVPGDGDDWESPRSYQFTPEAK